MTNSENNKSTIQCRAAKDPMTRAVIGLCAVLAGAGWCAYDIFIAKKYVYKPFNEDINAWGKYVMNFAGAVVLPLLAIFIVYKLMKFRSVVFEADNNGISKNGTQLLKWAEISSIDATKLSSKDIIIIKYLGKSLELDGWKLTNFREMLEVIQSNVPADLMKV